jgi:hypothetical protein
MRFLSRKLKRRTGCFRLQNRAQNTHGNLVQKEPFHA